MKMQNLSQDLYCVRSDLGNLLKALGRLDEAKVRKTVAFQWEALQSTFLKLLRVSVDSALKKTFIGASVELLA